MWHYFFQHEFATWLAVLGKEHIVGNYPDSAIQLLLYLKLVI
jgi:hypothetical protein